MSLYISERPGVYKSDKQRVRRSAVQGRHSPRSWRRVLGGRKGSHHTTQAWSYSIADELAGHGCCVDLFLRECLLALGELTNQELWKVLHAGSSSLLWVSPVLDKKT